MNRLLLLVALSALPGLAHKSDLQPTRPTLPGYMITISSKPLLPDRHHPNSRWGVPDYGRAKTGQFQLQRRLPDEGR